MEFARFLAATREQIRDFRHRIHAIACSQRVLIELDKGLRNPLPGGQVRALRRAAFHIRECMTHLEEAWSNGALSEDDFKALNRSAQQLFDHIQTELNAGRDPDRV
jgi:hypothetical protein